MLHQILFFTSIKHDPSNIILNQYPSNIIHRTLSIEHYPSNIFHRTLSIKHFSSNIIHYSSNIIHQTFSIRNYSSNIIHPTQGWHKKNNQAKKTTCKWVLMGLIIFSLNRILLIIAFSSHNNDKLFKI